MALAVILWACAGCDSSTPSAPAPTPLPVSANQAPLIVVGAVTPTLGIVDVTTFTVPVEVTDPDRDQVALTVTGCSLGTESRAVLENGVAHISFNADRACGSSLGLKATDARGASSQATVRFQATELSGRFRLVIGDGFYSQPYFAVNLAQVNAVLTGTLVDQRGHRGTTDPDGPGTIDGDGRFRLRFKIESEDDLILTGQVVSGSRDLFNDVIVASGWVVGSPYGGHAFQLWHEAQY